MPLNGKNVTWQWLVGILMVLLLSAGGIILADNRLAVQKTQVRIDEIQKEKVDKEQYYRDIASINDILKAIDLKIDKLRR